MTKEILVNTCQDFINSYFGKQGQIDFSHLTETKIIKFGIDEGFHGDDEKYRHIVIQGTDEKLEWHGNEKSNFNFFSKAFHIPENKHLGHNEKIKIHSGFFQAYRIGREMLLQLANCGKNIIVKGHSRGGAIATLLARDIQWHVDNVWKTNQHVILITGGSPMVYNSYGAKEFDQCWIESYRLVYCNDIVSRVPFFGYKHIGGLLQLGKPYLWIPIGLPYDHYPWKYLKAMKEYKGEF